MKFHVCLSALMGVAHLCWGQSTNAGVDDRGFLFNRRPLLGGGGAAAGGGSWASGSSPCAAEDYDSVDERSLLAVLGGAAIGGVVGGAAGYHLGMKGQRPVVINNNVYNQLPSPCYSIPVHVTTTGGGSGGGGGGGWTPGGGGGLVGGILSNHPILSNIISGGLGGGGLGGRGPSRSINRSIRQFQRQVVRPVSRLLK